MQTSNSSLPVNLAIIRASGDIVSVNEGWKRFGKNNGLRTPWFGLGTNYLEYCNPTDCEAAQSVQQIRGLLVGDVDLVSFPYRCDSPRERRTFVLIGAPLDQAPKPTFVLLHLNISAMIGRCSNSHMSKAVEWNTSRALTDHLAQMNFSEMISHASEPAVLLTEKEREVLNLLGQGMTNKEMAARLSRSPNTIKIHVSHILEKLNLRSRTEAALTSFNFGKSAAPTETAEVEPHFRWWHF
jgi:DNA-binding CsgD family transcriptional regulator